MSCGGGGSCHYPKPTDRSGGPGLRAVNADSIRRQRAAENPGGGGGGGGGGYGRFYSARLNRVSNRVADIVAEPSSARLRDVAIAVLAVYALYRSAFTLMGLYALFAQRPVVQMCGTQISALSCSYVYLWTMGYYIAQWLGDVVMWWVAGAVGVFFLEEVARLIPSRAKA